MPSPDCASLHPGYFLLRPAARGESCPNPSPGQASWTPAFAGVTITS